MQFKNIAIKEIDGKKLYLVKYDKKYYHDIRSLITKNNNLATEVMTASYNNINNKMGYLIWNGSNFLGAIVISIACEIKNSNLEIWLDDDKLSQDEMFKVIDYIVTSLGWYLYEKENFLIYLDNVLDLTTYNRHKYERKPVAKNKIIYKYYNGNHKLLSALIQNMAETQDYLLNMNQYWYEENELDSLAYVDENLIIDKKYIYPLEESFYASSKVNWNLHDTSNNKRIISFQKDGKIEYSKTSLKDESLSYKIRSWTGEKHFRLVSENLKMDLENLPEMYIINKDGVQIVVNRIENTKQYRYSSVDDMSKIDIELRLNGLLFEYFNITFYTYNNAKYLESEYFFEIDLNKNTYSFKHLSSEGTIDLIPYLKEEDKILLFNLKKGNLPIDKLDKTVQRLVKVVNEYANCKNLNVLGYENLIAIEDLLNIEADVINYLKNISGEILVPDVKFKVQDFLKEKSKFKPKYLTRSRSLKKNNK